MRTYLPSGCHALRADTVYVYYVFVHFGPLVASLAYSSAVCNWVAPLPQLP